MPPRPKAARTPPPPAAGDASSIQLQERLHELLTRLSTTVDRIKNWPGASGGADDASIHIESTGKLIQAIRSVLQSIMQVETVVQTNQALRTRLNQCQVPVDLLDLLDHGGGLNPECFARGLLEEAAGQLQGLKRRKVALERLGAAVHAGLQKKIQQQENRSQLGGANASLKRQREDDEDEGEEGEEEEDSMEPPAKRTYVAED